MIPNRTNHKQGRLFEQRLSEQLNPNHELCLLASLIDWETLEKQLLKHFDHEAGATAKPVRLIVGIMLLQQMYALSDEEVVYQWVQNPYWQLLCGYDYLQWEFPIHPTTLTKWRKRLGTEGIERVLHQLISTSLNCGMVKKSSFKKVISDTTVMPKAIAYPTDAKLYCRGISLLVRFAKNNQITLRQTYHRLSVRTLRKANRLLHARKYKMAQREIKRLKTYLGRVFRDVLRQLDAMTHLAKRASPVLVLIANLLLQTKDDKSKIYSLHEPHVDCLTKGKAGRKYEFGCKASIVLTHKEGLVLAAVAHHGAPYDGHILNEVLLKAEQNSGKRIEKAFVDKGYRGHGIKDKEIYLSGSTKGKPWRLRKDIARRQSIEPHIGHMKSDGKLGLNYLKGKLGDQLNAILAGIGHNARLLINFIRRQHQHCFT
jgi:IS5 family transposase